MQTQAITNILKRPVVMTILAAVLGLLLGLLIGWVLWPTKFVDATPAYLRADLQEDYLRMAIDSFRLNPDINVSVQRWQELGPHAPQLLDKIATDPRGLDPQAILAYRQMIDKYAPKTATPQPSAASAIAKWVIAVLLAVLLLVGVVAAAIYLRRLLRKDGGEPSVGMKAAEISRQTEKTDYESLGLAPPITQTMTTYILGDDLYDESFSIDTQGGEFLGEYGVGVSETIGVGDPKKVTALELWLFDKNDIKTATKVLMSAHAFDDAGIRSRLEPKGELVLVEPQKQIILETETLQLLATVVDLQYGQGPLPPNSHFERLTLELAIWPKANS